MKKKIWILFPLVVFLYGCSKHDCSPSRLRQMHAQQDEKLLGCTLIHPDRPLAYNDVIHLAVTRNIDLLVKAEEYEIQKEMATSERLGMLPTLTNNYFLEGRSNVLASFSRSISTGQVSVVQSTSTEDPARRWDFTLAWSILDFGMSYFKSRQEENKAQVLIQQHLRFKQNLVLNATKLYWKAIVAKKGADDACALIQLIKHRQKDIEKEIRNRTISSLEGLDNERHLVELEVRLITFEQELAIAKAELSGLIGLRVGPCFDLAPPPSFFYVPPNCMEYLIKTTLNSRPELMGQDYDEKIQYDEVYIATLKMFPNAQLFSSYNRDQNFFLLHQYWLAAGIRASWDFLSLPKNFYNRIAAKDKISLSRYTRLSLSVGVFTQVYMSYLEYIAALERYQIAHELATINARLLDAAFIAQRDGEYHLDNVIKIQGETFLSNLNALESYGELQISLERLGNAIGRPLTFSELATCYYEPQQCLSLSHDPWASESFQFDLNYHAIRAGGNHPQSTYEWPMECLNIAGLLPENRKEEINNESDLY